MFASLREESEEHMEEIKAMYVRHCREAAGPNGVFNDKTILYVRAVNE